MPSDDLKHYATSETDFYELLGVTLETSQKDIDRAWRKTALKYHPDKVGNDAAAKDKFHLAQIGYDLLSDPSSKAIYDNARNARLQRKRQNELLEGRRRHMKDDLEARERGFKRTREEAEGEEEKLERELRRLAEDGKRRRKEREEALRRDMEREREKAEKQEQRSATENTDQNASDFRHEISELDRTVKVRWPAAGEGESITADQVEDLFSTFGKVESATLLLPKMLRLSSSKKKQLGLICMVQYSSMVGAHAAVEDFRKRQGPEWQIFDSVFWASGQEPNFLQQRDTHSAPEASDAASTTPALGSNGANPFEHLKNGASHVSPRTGAHNGGNLKKKPTFASFSTAGLKTFTTATTGSETNSGTLSLEEITMIRLKEAEKRRLAAEIQRQDEAEDAAAMEDKS